MQATIEGACLRHEIAERGYAELEHGIEVERFENAVVKYANFTTQLPNPSEELMSAMLPPGDTTESIEKKLDDLDRTKDTASEWHKYRTNVEGVGKPDGQTDRSFQVATLRNVRGIELPEEDAKEYYHFTPRHYANMVRIHEELGWGSIPPEVEALNAAIAPIHKKAVELIMKVCGMIEETHPEIRDLIVPESLATSPVRLLFYHPSDRTTLAAGHYDKGSMTLQLAESHEGLRVAPDKYSDLSPIKRDPEHAVFFAARKLQEEIPDAPFPPGWHDVEAVDVLNRGRSMTEKTAAVCARWAFIFFANGTNYVSPDKSVTHMR